MMSNLKPYENLDPDLILDAIESLGLSCTGTFHALNSYENRVYQIGIEDSQPVIAKFYRPNRWSDETILEEHQFALELVEYEIPVVAPWVSDTNETLHHYQGFRFSLFQRWGGRALELDNIDQLEWMGRFIGRLHAVSAVRPFHNRPRIDAQSHGYDSYQFLIKNNFIPDYLNANYCRAVEILLKKIDHCYQQVGAIDSIRLHGDLHAGNVLWDDAGPHIVDLDDCLTGPAVQDIWMLLSGNEDDVKLQLKRILKGYREFHDFNPIELHLIEALRALRMLHHSAWIARRWEDPAFPLNFPWFNTPTYWQEQLHYLNEQIELIND